MELRERLAEARVPIPGVVRLQPRVQREAVRAEEVRVRPVAVGDRQLLPRAEVPACKDTNE